MVPTGVKEWGNSQGIRLPKEVLRSAGIELNEFFDVQLLEILLRIHFIYGWLQKKMKVIYNVKNWHC